MSRIPRPLLGLAIVAVVVLLTAGSAVAGGPIDGPFNENFSSESVRGDGDFTPLTGFTDCGATHTAFILWYAPGTTQDYLWRISDIDPLDYTSAPISVNGDYEPVLGDFDADGCDDILWYGPGAAQDYVWWGDDDGSFTTAMVTVNGTYEPIVGDFSGDNGDDIFWYAPGPGAEFLWEGRGDRTFASSTAPSVNGTYRTAAISDEILFHAPGPAQDYLWAGIKPGADAPASSTPVDINGSYEPLTSMNAVLLYAEGPSPDYAIVGYDDATGTLETIETEINGTYETGVRSPNGQYFLVWHAPGRATDFLWYPGSAAK